MSAEINNSTHREQVLADMIKRLHDGATVDDVKDIFDREFGNVSATEIAAA